MLTRKDIRNIILFIVAVLAVGAALVWLLSMCAPFLIGLIAFPAWLAAALADGANVK